MAQESNTAPTKFKKREEPKEFRESQTNSKEVKHCITQKNLKCMNI